MKHALQNVFFLSVLVLPTLFSAPILFRGDLSPANTAYTISSSGVYKLTSAKTASGVANISITANNVTLDLGGNTLSGGTNGIEITGNNVTVKNGTVSGMTQSGVLVQGAGCRIENCDIVSSVTGITLQNTSQCVIENCRVRTMTQAGVSLQSTWTSCVHGCEIFGLQGTTSVYGVYAVNGGNNIIDTCTIRSLSTSSSTGGDKIVGGGLSGESASTVRATTIQAVESLTTVSAYGVWIDGGNNAVLKDNSIAQVTTSNGVGVGVFVNQQSSYVAGNLSYDCDTAFAGVPTQFIDSQANARGVYNIDTSLTTPDEIEAIYNDQLPTIENQADGLVAPFNALKSTVDSLPGCADIPVRGPGTLFTAGTYCLADTINGTLSITGTDISVCMNEHTINGGQLIISGDRVHVTQGTVRNNAAASGVVLTGDNCFVNNIRSINNQTGFELSSADQNVIMNCSAIGCTREGFLLNNSTRNYVADCDVQSLVGTGTVAGIKTTNGMSNKITDCTVNGVSTTNGDAYGIWGVTEKKSILSGNTVNDMSATGGKVKGISLEQDAWLRNATSFEWTFSTAGLYTMRDMDWVSVAPDRSYLAVGVDNAAPLRIFRLDGSDKLNLCYEYFRSTEAPRMVQWLKVKDTVYLVVGWNLTSVIDVRVYMFDTVSETLLDLPNATYNYDSNTNLTPLSGRWLVYPDGRIFLLLCGEGGHVQILNFDGENLVLAQKAAVSPAAIFYADWCMTGSRIFIAVPVFGSTANDIWIYEFDVNNNNLTLKTTGGSASNSATSAQWLAYNDQLYIAATYNTVSVHTLEIMSYNIATNTLTTLTGVASAGGYQSDWLVSGTSVYIALGTVTDPYLDIYSFDPGARTLTSYVNYSFSGADRITYLQWFAGVQGQPLLGLGFYANTAARWRAVTVLGFDMIGSTTSLLHNNTVSNIAGAGIAANSLADNVFANSVYNATTPYESSKPYQFDPSNKIISG